MWLTRYTRHPTAVREQVITTGGYREAVTLPQIKTNMEMDSHEEKLALMIKQSKMDSAKDQAARQAKAIRERQRELVRVCSRGDGRRWGCMLLDSQFCSVIDMQTRTPPLNSLFPPPQTPNRPFYRPSSAARAGARTRASAAAATTWVRAAATTGAADVRVVSVVGCAFVL